MKFLILSSAILSLASAFTLNTHTCRTPILISGRSRTSTALNLNDDEIMELMQQSLLVMERRVASGPASLKVQDVADLKGRMDRILADVEARAVVAAPPAAAAQADGEAKYKETSDEEGAAYDGKGGMGLASGTANTWIIDGMDEMTGEEYRAALQKTVSSRQAQRKRGTVGNANSNNYLSGL
mmetsp:Transcript_2901/g.2776  ORF Transcript_2901/g.2776 Transcript_2901/m.2776 type:complete len:183 (+) Transcript_2901:90-638(+)